MRKRVPAYIITGFLGSGKTTVLQKMLSYCKQNDLKAAIVVNEVGETNVEQDLFADEHVLELLNGCICCSIQTDFTKELHSFITSLGEEEYPDLLFIESTGIANPLEIIDTLTDPQLIECLDLYSVINIVDGSKFIEYQSIFSSSKEVRAVFESQITSSSIIMINKSDLIDQKIVEKVRKNLAEFKREDAPVIETSYGEMNVEHLLERRISIHRTSLALHKAGNCSCKDEHTCTIADHDHHHNHSFKAIKIDVTGPIDRITFEKWLQKLPNTLVRGKGIVRLTETIGLFQFQYSSNQLQFTRLKATNMDLCVILIGIQLNVMQIENSFYEAVLSEN